MGRECLAAGDSTPPSPIPQFPMGKEMERTAPGAREGGCGTYEKNPPTPRLAQRANAAKFILSREQIRRWGNCGYWPSIMRGRRRNPRLFSPGTPGKTGPFQRLASGMFGPRAHWTKQGPGLPIWGSCPPPPLGGISYLVRAFISINLHSTEQASRRAGEQASRRAGTSSGTTWLGTGAWIPNFLVRSK